MTIKSHNDKLTDNVFSIGISKKVPEGSANLAFVSAPKINNDNVSIIKYFNGTSKKLDDIEYDLYYSDENYLLKTQNGNPFINTKNIMITDEFTIKELPSDTPRPLFYKSILAKPIKLNNIKTIPYVYGYETRTLEQLENILYETDDTDLTPLAHIVTIKTIYGTEIDSSKIKVKLSKIQDSSKYGIDTYQVTVYHSLDIKENYLVSYKAYDGKIHTEMLQSIPVFSQVVDASELSKYDLMDNVYAIKQNGIGYNVYAPTELYIIDDENREPYEFKYRILGNLDITYNKDNKAEIRIGVLNFPNPDGSDDIKGIICDFIKQDIFPSYVSFINPHPGDKFWGSPENYYDNPDYWEINLNMPQHYINDYDLIIITGYGGPHDLSTYNNILKNYLLQGGKILIDNLSNDNAYALRLDFGIDDPIISYDYTVDVNNNLNIIVSARQFVDNGKFKTRYYDLTNTKASKIAYIDSSNIQIGPEIILSTSDNEYWTDIIKFETGEKCIGYKTYNNRGKIFLSNSGILKGFARETSQEVKQFIVNMILAIAEDKWVTTPWINDRVYHIDQLYDDEIDILNYERSISINNKVIAKKILSKEVRDLVAKYIGYNYYNQSGKYYVEAYEYGNSIGYNENTWNILTNVYIPTELSPTDTLYAYAVNTRNSNFNINTLQGFSKSDIKVGSKKIKFKFTIRPFTFVWRVINGEMTYEKLYASSKFNATIEKEISLSDGLTNLGLLSSMIPKLPRGTEWADKSKVFFEVKLGYYKNGRFVEDEQRVNLLIYDKVTGEYKFTKDGDCVISYNDLYGARIVKQGSTYIQKKKSEDIVVQVWTNYYVLTANRRVFAIKQYNAGDAEIELPRNLNTNENWHPRIKYLSFIKNSFDKEDYDRIAKTLKFKFEKDYILKRLKQYYGEETQDNIVLNLIAKLNNNDKLEDEDWQAITEAFDLIDSVAIYEYDIKEYHKQAWNPYEPLKKSTNELAKYIDRNTIQVQYRNIFINEQRVVRETLERVSSNIYKSSNANWLRSESVIIEVEDNTYPSGYRIIDPSTYEIDFNKGIVYLNDPLDIPVYATYYFSNVEIYKKLYSNVRGAFEELTKLDATYYDIPGISRHSRVLKVPTPIVYLADSYAEIEDAIKRAEAGEQNALEPYITNAYTIDYEGGFLKLNTPTTKRVFIKYSYEQVEKLTIKDYNSETGLIILNEPISFNDNVYVTYYYRDDFYEYKGYRDGDNFVYLDLNPTRGHFCTIPTYKGGQLKYVDVPTYELLNKTVYIYMMPSKVLRKERVTDEKLNKISSTEYKAKNANWIADEKVVIKQEIRERIRRKFYVGNNVEVVDTVIRYTKEIPETEYTINSLTGTITFNTPPEGTLYATYSYYDTILENNITIRHTFDETELRLLQLAHPEMIVLGAIKITNDYTKADLKVLDTRVRGGGLKEEITIEDIKRIDELSMYFWDISRFDGPSYYSNGIIVIKIPNTVLVQNGGKFTEEEIEEIVRKHLAFGIYPIIKYYEKE